MGLKRKHRPTPMPMRVQPDLSVFDRFTRKPAPKQLDGSQVCIKAQDLIDKKRYTEASAALEELLSQQPKNKFAIELLISAHLKNGELEKAESTFRNAKLQRSDGTFMVALIIGEYSRRGNIENARTMFDNTLFEGKIGPAIFASMACAYIKAGNFDDYRYVIDMGIINNSLDIGACIEIMDCMYFGRKYQELEAFVNALPKQLQDNPQIFLKKVEALRKLKRYNEAICLIKEFLKRKNILGNDYERANTILAYCLKDSGNKGEALDLFHTLCCKVRHNSPHYPRILCGFVFSWQKNGYDKKIDYKIANILYNLLESTRKKGEINSNLERDIDMAMRILERKFNCKKSTLPQIAIEPAYGI